MNHKARITKLEKHTARADMPAWAEMIGNGRAVLRYQDGRRVEVSQDEVPAVKVYDGIGPDDWKVIA